MANSNPTDLDVFPSPNIEGLLSKEEFLEQFKARCIALSGGAMQDFSNSSPLAILGEAIAQQFYDYTSTFLKRIFPEIVSYSWSLLGPRFARKQGAYAVAIARFQLDAVYPTTVEIPAFYRFSVSDKVFEITQPVLIPGGTDSSQPQFFSLCMAPARAIEPGFDGNKPPGEASITDPINGLSSIWLTEGSKGGLDLETAVDHRNRVAAMLAGLVGNQPILNVGDFELAAAVILPGSTAIAIPQKTPTGEDQLAAMSLFVLGPDGEPPNTAQLATLSAQIGSRAPLAKGRLYVQGLDVAVVNVVIDLKPLHTAEPEALMIAINARIRQVFNTTTTARMTMLDINQLTTVVYTTSGVDYAQCYWGEGDAQPLAVRLTPQPVIDGTTVARPARIDKVSFRLPGSELPGDFTSIKREFTQ